MTGMPPEPCRSGEHAPATVPPLLWTELVDQLHNPENAPIDDIPLTSQEYL